MGGNFDTAFSEYVEQFEYSKKYSYIVDSEHVEQFKDFIFKGIEMRRSIEIINRSQLIHTLLNSGSEKMDISYMCVEIVLTFWKSIIDNGETTFSHPHCFSNGVSHSNSNNHPCVGIPKGLQALEDIYETADRISDGKWTRGYCFKESGKSCISVFDIWGIILISMAEISGHSCISLSNGHFQDDYLDYVAEYWKMLQIIN